MSKKILLIGVILLTGVMAGCAPFIDSRREAGQVKTVGQSTPDRPAVCYMPFWTGEETLQAMADEVCAKQNKKAVLADTSYFNCRLFAPNTAFYRCE